MIITIPAIVITSHRILLFDLKAAMLLARKRPVKFGVLKLLLVITRAPSH